MKYVVIKSPSMNAITDMPLDSSQSLNQNTDRIKVVKPNVDKEKLNKLSETEIKGIKSYKEVIKHCTVHLTRLSPTALCEAQSNHHQPSTKGSCKFSLKPSGNGPDESDNALGSSEKSQVIVKRLADDESSIAEKLHRKKRKFRGLPIVLEGEMIGASLLTVDTNLNCDTCSRLKKRCRPRNSDSSHLSLVDENNYKLDMTPTATCEFECQASESSSPQSLHSLKKMRISFDDLSDIAGFEERAVQPVCSSRASVGQPSEESPSSVILQLTAMSSKDEKKYCSARRNIFHTPRWSQILNAAPQLGNCDLPDLKVDENDTTSNAVVPSFVDLLTVGDLCKNSFNSASLYTDCFDKVDGLPGEKLKETDRLNVSPTMPVLGPVDCCNTVVFNLVRI